MATKERPGSERGAKGWGAIVEFFINGHALGSAQDGVFSKSLGCFLHGIYRSAGIDYWWVPKARRTLSAMYYSMLMRMMPKSSRFGKRLKCFQSLEMTLAFLEFLLISLMPPSRKPVLCPCHCLQSLRLIYSCLPLHRPCRVYSKYPVYVSSLYV